MSDSKTTPFRHELRVPYADVDQMGFVYYANYLVYFEMARAQLLRDAGLPYARLEERGILLPVVEAHCDYKRPAHFDDLLVVLSRCAPWGGARLRIEYEVRRMEKGNGTVVDSVLESELIMTGYTVHVCMSPDGRVLRPIAELKGLTECEGRAGNTTAERR